MIFDRDHGETKSAFNAFLKFRNFGPTRNVDRVFRASQLTTDESKRAPTHWWRWNADHNWKARAEAWDEHNEKIQSQAHEDELRKLGRRQAEFKIRFQPRIEKRFDMVEAQLEKAEAAPITDIVRDEEKVTAEGITVKSKTKIKGTNLSGYARLNKEWRDTGTQGSGGNQQDDEAQTAAPKAVLPDWLAKSFQPVPDQSVQ